MQNKIRAYGDFLCVCGMSGRYPEVEYILPIARLGRDPEFYAELGIEQVETTNNPVIARMLDEIIKAESFEAWFRELQSIEPTVITSQRWFELFFLAVRDAINAKSQEPDDH